MDGREDLKIALRVRGRPIGTECVVHNYSDRAGAPMISVHVEFNAAPSRTGFRLAKHSAPIAIPAATDARRLGTPPH